MPKLCLKLPSMCYLHVYVLQYLCYFAFACWEMNITVQEKTYLL